MKSALPKVIHPVCGRPLLAYPLHAAFEVGCDPVVVVVGHGADLVKKAVEVEFPKASLAHQAQQKGTADAVLCAREPLERSGAEWVLILYGDCPLLTAATLKSLVERVQTMGASLGLLTAVVDNPTGYGRLVRGADGLPRRIVEHKDATETERAIQEINAGVYLVRRSMLFDTLSRVDNHNVQKELYLPDIVELCAKVGPVAVVQVEPNEVLGVNSRVELAEAESIMQARIRKAAQLGGCTLKDPASTFIDASVRVGQDVELGPGVQLRGRTVLEDGVRVEGPAVIVDSTVRSGAFIKAFSHVEGAQVGRGALVGPYARLRPETVLEEDVHVGNFVEVKKSTLKRGAKANHLTYLGDASVGERTNVGAGTITCNYDGYGKYLTDIGAEVFIGSDSVLVAPVKIGKGAYVAAGSVITEDVQPDALALGRARQEQKAGRAEQIRQRAKQKAGK